MVSILSSLGVRLSVAFILVTVPAHWVIAQTPKVARTTSADLVAAQKVFEPVGFHVTGDDDRLCVVPDFRHRDVTDDVLKRLPRTDLRFTRFLTNAPVTATGLKE